mmetsp:Transcript_13396/g.57077  ORF Transcript_13396/g.57077 Transcript_13396/m.57077 type:complete len:211 (+) Transcript_13396:1236-1868(+)
MRPVVRQMRAMVCSAMGLVSVMEKFSSKEPPRQTREPRWKTQTCLPSGSNATPLTCPTDTGQDESVTFKSESNARSRRPESASSCGGGTTNAPVADAATGVVFVCPTRLSKSNFERPPPPDAEPVHEAYLGSSACTIRYRLHISSPWPQPARVTDVRLEVSKTHVTRNASPGAIANDVEPSFSVPFSPDATTSNSCGSCGSRDASLMGLG